MSKYIEVKNLSVRYNGTPTLKNINFRIEHPSFLVIMGPNGAGKTTLLKAIMGLVPYEGDIRILGKAPKEARNFMGYMPQRDRINTNVPLRVRDVVLMPLLSRRKFGISREEVEQAKRALRFVGLEKLWNRNFLSLSGGQQQRVFLARTLAMDPQVIVLDEPFSATDVATKMKVVSLLHRLKSTKTIILVTHDINPLVECTDKVLLLNREMIAFGRTIEVITEENMELLYGARVPVIRQRDVCYLVGSDTHVHH